MFYTTWRGMYPLLKIGRLIKFISLHVLFPGTPQTKVGIQGQSEMVVTYKYLGPFLN